MKLMLLLHCVGACASLRVTHRRGEEITHHTAFRVGGSLSEEIMGDKYNVKDIVEQILRAGGLGNKTHVAKIIKLKKSDNQKYYLCEWESDVSEEAFAKVYQWTEEEYAALNQWARSNTHPKIVVKHPFDPDTTEDIDQSHFKIYSIEPFKWDNRPKQYRMVAIKVNGEKRDELIGKQKMKEFLDHVLLDASDLNHPQIEIKKIAPDETNHNVVRVGFVTKMTEAEIADKCKNMNYGPLNNIWTRKKFPKILENGTIIESTSIELKIIYIRPDFESAWYREYHSSRGGHYTHLTAFNVNGLLSEKMMLDAANVKDLIEHIIIEEKYRVETNQVTIIKLIKADNQKSILCEWRSDLTKDQFGIVFDWTDEHYANLNQWVRTNLKQPTGSKILDEPDFQILKMTPFKWDTNDEGLQMVAIKLRGTETNKVYEPANLEVLLEHLFADESDPNHPIVKIWRISPSETNPDFKRVGFLTKIPLEAIEAKLNDMNYYPLNIWARNKFTVNKTVHELKIIRIEDDFELRWYQEYLGQDWNMLSWTELD